MDLMTSTHTFLNTNLNLEVHRPSKFPSSNFKIIIELFINNENMIFRHEQVIMAAKRTFFIFFFITNDVPIVVSKINLFQFLALSVVVLYAPKYSHRSRERSLMESSHFSCAERFF